MKIDNRPPSVVRISPELYAELARLAEMTRRPISEIASMAIRCGLSHSTVTPVQLYNIEFFGEKEKE